MVKLTSRIIDASIQPNEGDTLQSEQTRHELHRKMTYEGAQILAFWRKHVLRPDGAFHGEVENDGTVHEQADRGLILAARILWTYSRAVTSDFESSDMNRVAADLAYSFLREHFWDPVNLGFYWMLDATHQPLNTRKHIYAQAFAIYAMSEYYAATESIEALATAQLTYQLIETYAKDVKYNGYFESFTASWSPDDDLRLSAEDMNEAKSMNTHLHILEAYTRLYHVWPSPTMRASLENLLDVVETYIVDASTGHYLLFFDEDWSAKSDVISYGHDIEGSWLMLEAAEALGDEVRIERLKALAVRIVDVTLAEGLDADGGVMNEGRGHTVIDTDKHWWPQAEAVVGCVNAYQITGNTHYLEVANHIWGFIETNIRDDVNGEWFWKVDRSGTPDSSKLKVEPWKCPYHNARACMEVWQRLAIKEA